MIGACVAMVWVGQHKTLHAVPELKVTVQSESLIGSKEIAQWVGPLAGQIAVKYRDVESKILQHEWIKSVQLIQPRPDVLEVIPEVRRPAAVWSGGGKAAYVDEHGDVFGELDLRKAADLPVVSGGDPKRTVKWIQEWSRRGLDRWATVASVHEGSDGELRAVILPWRATLHWESGSWEAMGDAWSRVVEHLAKHHVTPRQIWIQDTHSSGVPSGLKKVVVKIVSRS